MYLHDKFREHGGPSSAGKTVLQKHQQSTVEETRTFNSTVYVATHRMLFKKKSIRETHNPGALFP